MAIIGPTDDWKDLREGAEEFGISDESVNQILNAGMELKCPGTKHGNSIKLNGWLLKQSGKSAMFTNSHAFYDENAKGREPFGECTISSFTGESTFNLADSVISSASNAPSTDAPQMDRAMVTPESLPENAAALDVNFNPADYVVGKEVFLVSRRTSKRGGNSGGVMIQKCTIKKVAPVWNNQPPAILTDCDNEGGVSAGMYFVRDSAKPENIKPFALHSRSFEKVGDNKPWDAQKNTTIGLVMDSHFFNF